jgi:hypothetical protein
MRCEQNGLPDLAARQQARDEVGTAGQNFLKFDLQPGVRSGDSEEIGDAFFPGLGMAGGQKRGVYAG